MTVLNSLVSRTNEEFTSLIKKHKRCAIVRPTGIGKTSLLAEYARGKKCLFIVPRKALIIDIKARFYWLKDEDCNFITYAMLLSKYSSGVDLGEYFGDLDFICLDEMHRAGAELWSDAINSLFDTYSDIEIAGASATPVRRDSIDVVSEYFSGIQVFEYTLLQAIQDKILPQVDYVCAKYDFDDVFTEIKLDKVKGSKIEKTLKSRIQAKRFELSNTLNVPKIIRSHLETKTFPMKLIVFFSNKETLHAKANDVLHWFNEAFPNKGVSYYTMYHELGQAVNDTAFREFSQSDNEDIKLLFNIDMLSEGVHVEGVAGVILLRKTNSHVLFTQQVGRCLKVGGEAPVVFDFVNNIFNKFTVTKRQEDREFNSGSVGSYSDVLTSPISVFDYTLDIKEYISLMNNIINLSLDSKLLESSLPVSKSFTSKVVYLSTDEAIKETAKEFLISQSSVRKVLNEFGVLN